MPIFILNYNLLYYIGYIYKFALEAVLRVFLILYKFQLKFYGNSVIYKESKKDIQGWS